MPAPASVDDFLAVVRKSNQVDSGRLDAYIDQQRQRGSVPPDPRKLASLLIRDGLITNFQAEQFLLGKYRGFQLGGYRLLERLGQGGSGTVYLAEHEVMKRRVALKVLPPNLSSDESVLERFRREAQASAVLDHPNIVRAFDFRHEGSLYYLVMEYVNGPSLQQLLDRGKLLPVEVVCDYIRQTSLGLQHAHEVGIVHRDIKPANLLVDKSGVVKILDMGLARFAPTGEESLTKKFDDNSVMGTADYIAPEQAINLHQVDARADLYSLGATMYALLAGQPPFAEGSVTQKLLWHQMRDPVPLYKRRTDVSRELSDIVSILMAKDPDHRFTNALAVAEALAPYCPSIPSPPSSGTGSGRGLDGSNGLSRSPSSSKLGPSSPPPTSPIESEVDTIVERPKRSTRVRDEDSDEEDIHRRIPDIRNEPPVPASGNIMTLVLLFGTILAFLALVGGVLAILFWGSPPSVKPSQENKLEDPISKPIFKQTPPRTQIQVPRLPNTIGMYYTFTAHDKAIEQVDVSSDGLSAVTSSQDNTIRLWNLVDHTMQHLLRGHTATVHTVRYDRRSDRVLSSSADGTARLWDRLTGRMMKSYSPGKTKLSTALFDHSERHILTGGENGQVAMFEITSGKLIRTIPAHKAAITSMVLRDQQREELLSTSADKTLVLFDLKTGKPIRPFRGHSQTVSSAAIVPGKNQALSTSLDSTVRLWDLNSGKNIHTFSNHKGAVNVVAVSPNSRYAATGGADKRILLWNLQTRKLDRSYEGHTAAVNGLRFTPDGRHLVSVGADRTLRVWGAP